MHDLVEFLKARIDEDERIAKAAAEHEDGQGNLYGANWKHRGFDDEGNYWIITGDGPAGCPIVYDEGTPSDNQAAHIARFDPARVLREVEAKRRIIHEHLPVVLHSQHDYSSTVRVCKTCGGSDAWFSENDQATGSAKFPCTTLRALGSTESDHPDYKPEWSL